MSDRNGDGLPPLAAVKTHNITKLESEKLAAEFALSRRRKPDPVSEHEPSAEEHEPDEAEHEDVLPEQPADEHREEDAHDDDGNAA
jgi:hypothetical protein